MMKKIRFLSLFCLLILAFSALACEKKFTIEFMDGDKLHHSIQTAGNSSISLPKSPDAPEGKEFVGWFFDKDVWNDELTTDYFKTKKLSASVKVYAFFDVPLGETDANFDGFTRVTGTSYNISLPNNTSSFDFTNVVKVNRNSSWEVVGQSSNTVSLAVGDNVFTIEVTSIDGETKTYTLTLRVRPVYQISFDTYGGDVYPVQNIEEGGLATRPADPSKPYCTFLSWDHNFNMPILASKVITANWQVDIIGSGTESDPYQIFVAEQLKFYAKNINTTTSYSVNVHFALAADIDLNGNEWEPIGTGKPTVDNETDFYRFYGVFDGKDHTISNFKNSNGTRVGLFGVNEGFIKNLNVADFHFDTSVTNSLVGGLVADNSVGIIENCSVNGSIVLGASSAPNARVGGLAGSLGSGTIRTSSANIAIEIETGLNSADLSIGGLVGEANGGIISHSSAIADFSAVDVLSNVSFGGLIGKSLSGTRVFASFASGEVSLENLTYVYVGGLIGQNLGSVSGSQSSVSLNITKTQLVVAGGLVGENSGQLSDVNSKGSVSAITCKEVKAGGLVGESKAGAIEKAIAIGDVFVTAENSAAVGGFVASSISSITSSVAIGKVVASAGYTTTSTATLAAGGFAGSMSAAGTDIYRYSQQENILVQNAVPVDPSNTLGSLASLSELDSVVFYADTLSLDDEVWNYQAMDIGHGAYPSLRVQSEYFNYVKIGSAAELLKLSGASLYSNYVLTSDINLGGAVWNPASLYGLFDGAGYKISNYTITKNQDKLGFFGLNQGTVRNLGVKDYTIVASLQAFSSIGGLVGDLMARGRIINCFANGSIDIYTTSDQVTIGGLTGYAYLGAQIVSSYAAGTLKGEMISGAEGGNVMLYSGGLVGVDMGSVTSRSRSSVNINVSSTATSDSASSYAYSGGIAGYIDDFATVSDCYATGTIVALANSLQTVGASVYAGGFTGLVYSTNIFNCYTDVFLDVTGADICAGGFVGINYGKLTNCFAVGDIRVRAKTSAELGILVGYGNGGVVNSYRNAAAKVTLYDATTGEYVEIEPIKLMQSGQPIAAAQLMEVDTYLTTIGLKQDIWNIEPSSLPSLKGLMD